MKTAATEGEIATLRAAHPNEPVMFTRPSDKCVEVHMPHGEQARVYPPRRPNQRP
jgi:hypothetical protein